MKTNDETREQVSKWKKDNPDLVKLYRKNSYYRMKADTERYEKVKAKNCDRLKKKKLKDHAAKYGMTEEEYSSLTHQQKTNLGRFGVINVPKMTREEINAKARERWRRKKCIKQGSVNTTSKVTDSERWTDEKPVYSKIPGAKYMVASLAPNTVNVICETNSRDECERCYKNMTASGGYVRIFINGRKLLIYEAEKKFGRGDTIYSMGKEIRPIWLRA